MNKKPNYTYNAYQSWLAMKSRCNNPKRPNYYLYGGRGIMICEQWRTFEGFLNDMGERPEGFQLDRIDTNGNYEPSNCKWATAKENSNNRRIPESRMAIVGDVFGYWTVLSITDKRTSNGDILYLCQCECGFESMVKGSALRQGSSTKCKTCALAWARPGAQELIGNKYNHWTIKSIHEERSEKGNIRFICICDCGKEQIISKTHLLKGRSRCCFECYVKLYKTHECSYCGCKGHKQEDVETSFCELLGFCRKCDGFKDYYKYQKKGLAVESVKI